MELAGSLQQFEDLSITERFFVEFYSNNFEVAWKRLNDKELQGTRLGKIYHTRMKKKFSDASKPYAWLLTGIWFPGGNLNISGNLLQLGGGFGYHSNGLFFDLNLAAGSIQSINQGQMNAKQKYRIAEGLKNWSVSIDIGKVFLIDRDPFVKMGLSLGYKSIILAKINHSLDQEKRIGSFLFGPLVEFNLPFSQRFSLGLNTRFNLLGFNKKPGSEFQGNAITIGAKIGIYLYDKNSIEDYHF
jgi:hypothetical protein